MVVMSKNEDKPTANLEHKLKGLLTPKGIVLSQNQSSEEISSRGYGVAENDKFLLTFYEGLYLLDKGFIEIQNDKGGNVDFKEVLQCYESVDENAWAKYLIYRDLRSRGYVVREGFGLGVDFRVYEKGEYGKGSARYLVLSMQEGKPLSLEDLTNAVMQSQNLKKELILAVMNRRGEIVYYSVSQLTLK